MIKRNTSIRIRLTLAFFGVSFLTAVVAAFSIKQQLDLADDAAAIEAEHVANTVAYTGIEDVIRNPVYLRTYVEGLHKVYRRDIVIVDRQKIGIADSDSTETGAVYHDDPNDEVAKTLQDGRTRRFTEAVTAAHPEEVKQVVVPIRGSHVVPDGPIVGAVIMEYTPMYHELVALAMAKIRVIGSLGALCIGLALITGIVLARRIAKPLAALTVAAEEIASGKLDTKVDADGPSEIGILGAAFNRMAADLKSSRDRLLSDAQQLDAANEALESRAAELAARNREITLFGRMNEFLQASGTEADAYAVISQTVSELFPEASGALFVFSASRNMLEAAMAWGSSPPANVVFTPDECWALRRGQGHLDAGHGPRCGHVTDSGHMYLCLPMVAHGETLGLLHIANGAPANREVDEKLMAEKYRLGKNLSEHMGLAIANLRLRETMRNASIRDPLTGLFNRRYMEEVLSQEFLRAKRNATRIAVIILDIDHFKRFNDNFGHDAGDAVLRELGLFLKDRIRGSDIACRYGGEEFVVILSPSTMEGARQRAEQLREDAKRLSVRHAHQNLGAITLSLGLAVFPEHGSEAEVIVKAADIALYQAKRGGRDRLVVFAGGVDQTAS
jgi:diguanylate cyclase (GGDEF)-like protein